MQGQILKCLLIGLLLNIGIAFAQTRECRIDWDNEHTLGTAQFVVDDQGTIEFTSYDPGDGLSGISGLINGSSFSLTMSYQVDSVKLFAIGTLEKPLEQIGNIQNHGEGEPSPQNEEMRVTIYHQLHPFTFLLSVNRDVARNRKQKKFGD